MAIFLAMRSSNIQSNLVGELMPRTLSDEMAIVCEESDKGGEEMGGANGDGGEIDECGELLR